MSQISQLLNEALARHGQGDLAAAEALYRQVLTAEPRQPDAWHLLGVIAYQTGQNQQALEMITRAIDVSPSNASYYLNRGNAWQAAGDLAQAAADFRRTIQIAPGSFDAHFNLGNALRAMDDLAGARGQFEQAIALQPDNAQGHNNLAAVLELLGKTAEAGTGYRRAVELAPDFVDAHVNLGVFLQKEGEYEGAGVSLDRALAINPNHVQALVCRGQWSQRWGRAAEAVVYYDRALKLAPENTKAQLKRAYALLQLGDFAAGWPGYEHRWLSHSSGITPKFVDPSLWRGESLAGQALLVHAEQGIGDEIMFASCFRELREKCQRLVVTCDHRLLPLFARSFPACDFHGLPCEKPILVQLGRQVGADFQIAAGSLTQFLRTSPESFRDRSAWLVADFEKLESWRQRLATLGNGMKIGISWRGGAVEEDAAARSLSLADCTPLLRVPSATFINLQYGDCRAEIDVVADRLKIQIYNFSDLDPTADLDSYAALVAALDLIISVDNSTVHFAGALGVPTWTLLSTSAGWRWTLGRDDSLWYGSMRLFRQTRPGHWDNVISAVNLELKQLLQPNRAS